MAASIEFIVTTTLSNTHIFFFFVKGLSVPSVSPSVPVPVYSPPLLGKKRALTVDKLKIEGRLGKKIH